MAKKTNTEVENPVLETSKQGVAVFAPGQHPKTLQLAAKKAAEEGTVVEPAAPVEEEVEEEAPAEEPAQEEVAEEAAEEPKKGKK